MNEQKTSEVLNSYHSWIRISEFCKLSGFINPGSISIEIFITEEILNLLFLASYSRVVTMPFGQVVNKTEE
jgi:hypothetical protein